MKQENADLSADKPADLSIDKPADLPADRSKRVGDVLSAIFDERLLKKARTYSSFFDFWAEALVKNGIAAAADHSRIKEFDRGILLVEADHPGWKQILQTKQSALLNDFRRRFPRQNVGGISLVLSKYGEAPVETAPPALPAEKPAPAKKAVGKNRRKNQAESAGYAGIKDGGFKEALKSLEKSISERERDLSAGE